VAEPKKLAEDKPDLSRFVWQPGDIQIISRAPADANAPTPAQEAKAILEELRKTYQ
jgi:hypothetical protein